jgi:aminoglycoside phosphotransferase (APT) family kinase protein
MDQDEALADLFGRWKVSLEQGAPRTPEELCRDRPELLAEFRKVLPRLAAVDALFEEDVLLADEPLLKPATIHDFASASFHKQGGLGVVLVAEEVGLGRIVALKCLKTQFARDVEAQQRFVREAETTARLEHPGIVPVYRRGHDVEGHPFYAMRFIQGETLGGAVQRWFQNGPTRRIVRHDLEFRRLLRALVAVSETIAYAHARGVVHRDLKPDNIMLGPFGEVLVVDWGLAKRLAGGETETSTIADDTLIVDPTRTVEGTIKGSPSFMSPEQAQGATTAIGPAADVYNLGATLYYVLTGRVPFAGNSTAAVLEKVRSGRFDTPRQVRSDVPKPLEAICLKAMANAREARYVDARELGSDLERWLADEPVSVYREPLAVRARRWIRRRPAVAAALLTALVLFACGGFALAEAEQRRLAELGEVHTKLRQMAVALSASSADGDVSIAQVAALEEARDFFATRAASGKPQYLFEQAAVENTLGTIALRRRDADRAEPYFETAQHLLERAAAADPRHAETQFALAIAWQNRSAVKMLNQDAQGALAWLEKARASVDDLQRRFPNEPWYRSIESQLLRGLATSHGTLATEFSAAKKTDEALAEFARAREYLDRFVQANGDIGNLQTTREMILRSYANLALDTAQADWQGSRLQPALDRYTTALPLWTDLAAAAPNDVNTGERLDSTRLGLAFAIRDGLRAAGVSNAPQIDASLLRTSLTALEGMTPKWLLDPEWRQLRDVLAAALSERERGVRP